MSLQQESPNYLLACAAKAYSRSQIIEGTTQLQNNVYDFEKQYALNKALKDIRSISCSEGYGTEFDQLLQFFENSIAACKKYSIGNCYEYAIMALEYIVESAPTVFAEIYHIEGGDHVFLVIGRQKNSDPTKPTTWGNEAFICDPWADAVYPSKEYLEKTKNFYRTIDTKDSRYINHTENFDPLRHKMEPMENENSLQIRRGSFQLNVPILNYFQKINLRHCEIFYHLANDLEKIAEKLSAKYSEEDLKVITLRKKINIIRVETDKIKQEMSEYIRSIPAYQSKQKTQIDLTKKMREELSTLRKNISSEEQNVLKEYRNEGSFKTLVMKFLHIKPTSLREYQASMEKAEQSLSRSPKV